MRTRFSSGLWVGTPEGLFHLNPSKHSNNLGVLLNIPSTGPIYDIFHDSRNWVWVAGHEGLFLRAKREWWRFIDPPGDILFKLHRIVENEVGDIYAAREDQYFWLKWSTHLGRGGVSARTLKKLAEPVKDTAASHAF
jgi:ligand-binding sensor domain-containing protein